MEHRDMEKYVYWCSVEYSYIVSPDSQGEAIGGFVYGFVRASDEKDARNKFTKELEKGGRREPIFDFVAKYDENIEWETNIEKDRYLNLFLQAMQIDQVIFDDFYDYKEK